MQIFAVLLTLYVVLPMSAVFASSQLAMDGSKVFIIQGREKPAKVLPAKKASEGLGIMMRMPNLDQSSVVGSPNSRDPQEALGGENKSTKKSSHKSKLAKKEEPIRLQFSKARIKGALRLPRVKFSKVGPPVEIREALPDIDFNNRTLTESGF